MKFAGGKIDRFERVGDNRHVGCWSSPLTALIRQMTPTELQVGASVNFPPSILKSQFSRGPAIRQGMFMNELRELNEHHRRRLLVSCQYIDQLLADIESVLAADSSLSPFPRYVQDLAAPEKQVALEQVARLRSQLTGFLKSQNIAIPSPGISARHSIITSLGFIDIAVEELKPRYLGGYGTVPPTLVPELNGAVEEVQASVKAVISMLKAPMQMQEAGPEAGAP